MDDVHYHHREWGRLAYRWSHAPVRDPLVVLHGLGDSAIHTYGPRFASTVLRDTPSLFIDFAGFGEGSADAPYPATLKSMAADVAALLSALRISDAPVFAHSMGANVALVLAHQFPGLVSQLVLAEPLLERDQSILAAGIAKQSEQSFLSRGYAMLVRATSLQAHRGDVAAQAFLPPLRMANPVSLHRAATSLLEEQSPDAFSLLQNLKTSSTLLVGEHTPADTTDLELAGIRIIRVPGAGHFMMAEQESATAYAILKQVI